MQKQNLNGYVTHLLGTNETIFFAIRMPYPLSYVYGKPLILNTEFRDVKGSNFIDNENGVSYYQMYRLHFILTFPSAIFTNIHIKSAIFCNN